MISFSQRIMAQALYNHTIGILALASFSYVLTFTLEFDLKVGNHGNELQLMH